MRFVLALSCVLAIGGCGDAPACLSCISDAGASPDTRTTTACEPVARTGCGDGEKCTWQESSATDGELACVPEGAVATGAACSWMAPGPAAGYDNCRAGDICIDDVCRAICTTTPDGCAPGEVCCADPSVFVGSDPPLGGCAPACAAP